MTLLSVAVHWLRQRSKPSGSCAGTEGRGSQADLPGHSRILRLLRTDESEALSTFQMLTARCLGSYRAQCLLMPVGWDQRKPLKLPDGISSQQGLDLRQTRILLLPTLLLQLSFLCCLGLLREQKTA